MSFEQLLKIPVERVGSLVGSGGSAKREIERRCGTVIEVNSVNGEVKVRGEGDVLKMNPFKAVEMVNAVGKGFSPQRAMRLLDDEECVLETLDLRNYVGKSRSSLERIKGRIIGLDGKARKTIEELTGSRLSVYGHNVGIIGTPEEAKIAREAVEMLAIGRPHKSVYNELQKQRAKVKMERLQLWEGEAIGR